MKKGKPEVITFKADPALVAAMEGISNRSEFIRSAILAALDGVCPLCQGTGILTPEQKRHWSGFAQHHRVERCSTCDAPHLVCDAQNSGPSDH
ncbi:MAG: ribbon-helix-helix domain-containing protein [Proteobacteria bacterium]|nr:ribbon-helix-helix domain-containing protein [Pseudomonadota bacterium]MBU4385231.1 ribbon-helix-helix domain-containing protein [Pseudomonadota bacterium]MBU4604054.1 ribbon-helix-helix domain-containing protein [Pseudomonadota bacterium]MCG2764839.1 ribbon-helix-helix domain-containing protein [Desulfarculaceae bacterium]